MIPPQRIPQADNPHLLYKTMVEVSTRNLAPKSWLQNREVTYGLLRDTVHEVSSVHRDRMNIGTNESCEYYQEFE